MDKKMTFEVQLLTLKREREVLKEGGAKHEDIMMKENAGMQVRQCVPFGGNYGLKLFWLFITVATQLIRTDFNYDSYDIFKAYTEYFRQF